jgi:hypothetical protein
MSNEDFNWQEVEVASPKLESNSHYLEDSFLFEVAKKDCHTENITMEEFRERVLKEFQPMFRYISSSRENRIMTVDDYTQEINTHLCRVIQQRFDEMKEFTPAQLRASVRTIAKNYVADLVGFYSRRPDTSVVATATSIGNPEETEDEFSSNRTVDLGDKKNTFEDFQFQFDINIVEQVLQRVHEPYCPGITQYFKECLEPSQEVADAFLKHRLQQKRQRNMAEGYIPPTILANLLGLPLARLNEYKRRIRFVLAQYDMISIVTS